MAMPADLGARALALAAAVERDLEDLDRVAAEAKRALETTAGRDPAALEIYGAGKIAHDFYAVAETVFLRVARALDGGEPAGAAWHRDLLRQAATAVDGVRPTVVSRETEAALGGLLRFRHRFRNVYALHLEWEAIRATLQDATAVAPALRAEIAAFAAFAREAGRAVGA